MSSSQSRVKDHYTLIALGAAIALHATMQFPTRKRCGRLHMSILGWKMLTLSGGGKPKAGTLDLLCKVIRGISSLR